MATIEKLQLTLDHLTVKGRHTERRPAVMPRCIPLAIKVQTFGRQKKKQIFSPKFFLSKIKTSKTSLKIYEIWREKKIVYKATHSI